MTDREYEMQVDRQMQSDYTEYRNEQRVKDEIKAKEELIKELLFKIEARDRKIKELDEENIKLNGEIQWYLCENEDTKLGLLEDENAELREKIKELENKQ